MTLRKFNRIIHRDFGYFFVGMIVIYSVSGIALNHRRDWNPSYVITTKEIAFTPNEKLQNSEKRAVLDFLNSLEIESDKKYKNHYQPSENNLKIFLHGNETLLLNFETNILTFESIKKRPFFYQINYLHYNPGKLWKWFSDIFAGSLIVIAITGLFILKGKNGITKRGAILVAIGIVVPLLFLLLNY